MSHLILEPIDSIHAFYFKPHRDADSCEFAMYRANVRYETGYVSNNGEFHEDEVIIEAFGLMYLIAGHTYIHGIITASQSELNYLINRLVKLPVPTILDIEQLIDDEVATWTRNKFSDAFGKVAQRKLKQQVEQAKGYHQSPLSQSRSLIANSKQLIQDTKELLRGNKPGGGKGLGM
jgi:hypothetical protein